jgi:hypothetical protein
MVSDEHSKLRPRAVLTEDQAIHIYSQREKTDCFGYQSLRSASLAKHFDVSPKTIRDIWNRRTWANETRHLWTEDEHPMIRTKKQRFALSSSLETESSKSISVDNGLPQHLPAQHAQKISQSPANFFASLSAANPSQALQVSSPASVSWIRLPAAQSLPPRPTPTCCPSPIPLLDYAKSLRAETAPLHTSPYQPHVTPSAEPPLPTAWPWGPAGGTTRTDAGRDGWDAGIAAIEDPFHSDWPHW